MVRVSFGVRAGLSIWVGKGSGLEFANLPTHLPTSPLHLLTYCC